MDGFDRETAGLHVDPEPLNEILPPLVDIKYDHHISNQYGPHDRSKMELGKYRFDPVEWENLIQSLILQELEDNKGHTIQELQDQMEQNENLSIYNIWVALHQLVKSGKVNEANGVYSINKQYRKEENGGNRNNDNNTNNNNQSNDQHENVMRYQDNGYKDDNKSNICVKYNNGNAPCNDARSTENVFMNQNQNNNNNNNNNWKSGTNAFNDVGSTFGNQNDNNDTTEDIAMSDKEKSDATKYWNHGRKVDDLPSSFAGQDQFNFKKELKEWKNTTTIDEEMHQNEQIKDIRQQLNAEKDQKERLALQLNLTDDQKEEIEKKKKKYLQNSFHVELSNVMKNDLCVELSRMTISDTEEDDDIAMDHFQPGFVGLSLAACVELLQTTDQIQWMQIFLKYFNKEFNETSAMYQIKKNQHKIKSQPPNPLIIIFRKAQKQSKLFIDKYEKEFEGDSKESGACEHYDGNGNHPKIPWSECCLSIKLLIKSDLYFSIPIRRVSDKLQSQQDFPPSRLSEYTRPTAIKDMIIKIKSHSIYTKKISKEATFFAVIYNGNNISHDEFYSIMTNKINTKCLATFGKKTKFFDNDYKPYHKGKAAIILKAASYDIYCNEICGLLSTQNDFSLEWIGSASNMELFKNSERDYQNVKDDNQKFLNDYNIYMNYLRVMEGDKYTQLQKNHFKDYDFNAQQIENLKIFHDVLSQCPMNNTAS